MTTLMNKLIEIGQQLSTSHTEQEFRQAIECAADFMGASNYNAMAFQSNEKGTNGTGIDNLPASYEPDGIGYSVGPIDPVAQHCRLHSSPISWDQSTHVRAGTHDIWEHIASHGMPQGTATALHIGKHRHFLLGFMRNRSKPLTHGEKIKDGLALQTLGIFAEPTVFRLWNPTQQQKPAEFKRLLTLREQECLYWVSRGMTDDLIARVMKISPRTIRKHVDSCMKKLSAANRTEAAVIATQQGLTHPEHLAS